MRLPEERDAQEHEKKKELLGGVSPTEVDAHPCSVPAAQLSHDERSAAHASHLRAMAAMLREAGIEPMTVDALEAGADALVDAGRLNDALFLAEGIADHESTIADRLARQRLR